MHPAIGAMQEWSETVAALSKFSAEISAQP